MFRLGLKVAGVALVGVVTAGAAFGILGAVSGEGEDRPARQPAASDVLGPAAPSPSPAPVVQAELQELVETMFEAALEGDIVRGVAAKEDYEERTGCTVLVADIVATRDHIRQLKAEGRERGLEAMAFVLRKVPPFGNKAGMGIAVECGP